MSQRPQAAPLNPMDRFEAVIGLEVHVQLSTESKIFCACPAKPPAGVSVADLPANAFVCPVCTGQPGALPVLNRKVVEYAVAAGVALGSRIAETSIFARKNYFYPDLPKGYQISQFDRPICEGGSLDVDFDDGTSRPIRLKRIHMEEDAGKNTHHGSYSTVNLNRAGVPLLEVVSEPDLRTPAEAGAWLRSLHGVVTRLGICDGNLQEGNFRCDANVSLRPRGAPEFGTRVEVKNVNSFRFVEKAIEHEILRQATLLLSGSAIVQETRLFDADRGVTASMRTKEEAEDYRYFPDPDLLPVRVESEFVNQVRARLPELPSAMRRRFVTTFGLSAYDAGVLVASPELSSFFDRTMRELEERGGAVRSRGLSKPVANWLTGDVSRRLNEEAGATVAGSSLLPAAMAELVEAVEKGELSHAGAREVISTLWERGGNVGEIMDARGLRQVNDDAAIQPVIDAVLADCPSQVAEFLAGKEKVMGFLVGQVLKRSGGKVNPARVQEMLKRKLIP